MTKFTDRDMARLCLCAAKGEDITDSVAQAINGGKSIASFVEDAMIHRVLALLAKQLLALDAGPDELESRLTPQFFFSRNLRLKSQLVQLDEALGSIGSRIVLLKGAVQLFEPIYPHIGMRDMADLDFLVDDPKAFEALATLGYQPQDSSERMPSSLELEPGKNHLPPVWRERDLVTLEAHVSPVSRLYTHLISPKFAEDARRVQSTKALFVPSPVDQLHVLLVHALLHDRDSMHGALFLRSLVECELLFDSLSASQRAEAERSLSQRGGGGLWSSWRAFADWCFNGDDRALLRSPGAWMLITEFRIRGAREAGVLPVALFARLARLFQPRYWTSGILSVQTKKLVDPAFWQRFSTKLKMVFRN